MSFFKIVLFFCKDLLCIHYSDCMYACRPEEGTRSHYRWLWTTMWLLAVELRTSGWAVSALNCWTISPTSSFLSLSAKATIHLWPRKSQSVTSHKPGLHQKLRRKFQSKYMNRKVSWKPVFETSCQILFYNHFCVF